ncbi:MAG: excinuclease ABC subunit UvrB [Salinivirgaceae bacterium]|nr:excinuclease ABC subunit UvrB [Salinivirgaceae bacterium]MDY0280628.1 excinuclease ABC subunit UvrB [Salinivirgaceae bacterium]
MKFKVVSDYAPAGDQPEAIVQLVQNIKDGNRFQTLLGVTGSGKTFTVANVIEQVQMPTLVLSHNKTLAAQLYAELKGFFPDNQVEYFVSYYDYYQPEAYLPVSDTYIEKDLSINEEIEKLRLRATSALLSGRNDVIVVSSVSCLYGIGNPADFYENVVQIKRGQNIARNALLRTLVDSLYSRDEVMFARGKFRVLGDTVEIWVAYGEFAIRISFWGDEIEDITTFDPISGTTIQQREEITIFPANIFVTTKERVSKAIRLIEDDLTKQVAYFNEQSKRLEAKRIYDRVTFDLEMIRELGYCSGIENYSRYFDGREAGSRPFCLLDYFPKNFLTVIDESHVTISQIRAMYGGDRSRKTNLVDYGFRLPAAIDNRPLKFEEFEDLVSNIIYVSATPADYELERSEGLIVEQVVRPTGLLDPRIEVRPSTHQVDDLLKEIRITTERNERTLVTTLTKRMAEELQKYLERFAIRSQYIHSDVDTLDRVEILSQLREGVIDVLVGVNLLREGLDLPEVSLVAILDADKEGFLRSERSLTQTAGRAARNLNGRVIMYANKITRSMQQTMDETNRRRQKQVEFNLKNNITPTQIVKKSAEEISKLLPNNKTKSYKSKAPEINNAAEEVYRYMSVKDLNELLAMSKQNMEKAAKELDFINAAQYRDEMLSIEKLLAKKDAK